MSPKQRPCASFSAVSKKARFTCWLPELYTVRVVVSNATPPPWGLNKMASPAE